MAKHAKHNFRIKPLVLTLLAVAILGGIFAITYAYLQSQTPTITNEFEPVKVTCEVEETFDGDVKKDVCIRNTGDVPAFIRAVVICNWVDDQGNVLSTAPVEGVDYTVQWGDLYWKKGTDGFWYHTKSVAPDATTTTLIQTLTSGTAPAGYHLQAQILATAIQSDPADAAESAWHVDVSGQQLTAP